MERMMNTITTTQLNTISIVLNGAFDAEAVQEIRPLFMEISNERESNVIIDMSHVSFIDSSGIGAIVYLNKVLLIKGFKLVLVGSNGQPLHIMQKLRATQSIQLNSSMQEYFRETGRITALIMNQRIGLVP
jgi:anti-anti-sigma factor